jgi:hypothetical protein
MDSGFDVARRPGMTETDISAAWNSGIGIRHGVKTQYLTVERLPCWYDTQPSI